MNRKENKPSSGSLKNVLLAILFMVGSATWVSSVMRNTKKEIPGEAHSDFPVLVITPRADASEREANIVYHGELARFLAEHPDFTFLVPPGAEQSLNDQLTARSRGRQSIPDNNLESPDPWRAYFKGRATGRAQADAGGVSNEKR